MPTLSIDQTLTWLREGNARFVAERCENPRRDQARRQELVDGQDPHAIVLSCADSRVAPEIAFDTGLGELFVVRVAGNIANTSSIASMEYAVHHLGTPVIVVLGHQSCGAVSAALKGGDNGHNLNHLVAHLVPAVTRHPGGDVDTVVHTNVHLQIEELMARSAIIRDAVAAGKLALVPACYRLTDGAVDFLDAPNS